MKNISAYPLTWPDGWPRTRSREQWSRFKVTQNQAQDRLMHELELLGARDIIMSTNIKLRNDGLPYANQPRMQDPGVAVYFKHKNKPMVFACDKFDKVGDNIHSIGLTVAALRGIERWGASDMMERAFTGFSALPPPGAVVTANPPWREVLDMGNDLDASRETLLARAERRYKVLAKDAHPDKTEGSHDRMQPLNWAREQARQELGS